MYLAFSKYIEMYEVWSKLKALGSLSFMKRKAYQIKVYGIKHHIQDVLNLKQDAMFCI